MINNIAATATMSTFRMECAVSCNIQAGPERIWQLLTDAAGFPEWNSTVKQIDGRIAAGEKIKLEATISPGRIFKLNVSVFEPNLKMIWEDGFAPMFKGVRTFTLAGRPDGSTDFNMKEVFSGLMLLMIKGSLPDFVPIFGQYANDLKNRAEKE